MTTAIRVAVVDDHPIYREGIGAILKRDRMTSLVGQGASANDCVTLGKSLIPDIMLVDEALPGDAFAALKLMARDCPSIGIIMMKSGQGGARVGPAMDAGAKGYILKTISARGLIATVKVVAGGLTYVDPQLTMVPPPKPENIAAEILRRPNAGLTCREEEILGHIANGLTNKEVARRLSISDKTVKYYMTGIMDKLQVRNRVEATLAYRTYKTTAVDVTSMTN